MASLTDPPQPVRAMHSNWVVQKFGGTSVGKFALNIIEQVVQYEGPSALPPINPPLTSLFQQTESCRQPSRCRVLSQKQFD